MIDQSPICHSLIDNLKQTTIFSSDKIWDIYLAKYLK